MAAVKPHSRRRDRLLEHATSRRLFCVFCKRCRARCAPARLPSTVSPVSSSPPNTRSAECSPWTLSSNALLVFDLSPIPTSSTQLVKQVDNHDCSTEHELAPQLVGDRK